MEIAALLKSFIYLMASSIFLPVLVLLSGLTIWLVIHAGGFFGLWLNRKRLPDQVRTGQAAARTLSLERAADFSRPVREFLEKLQAVKMAPCPEIGALNLLKDCEHQLWQSLDGLKLIVRIGPGLGLIGTLIPMGTGLAALGQGDLTRLSSDLVVAFTTTVVGMTLGLAGYFFFTIQRRWVEQDVKHMALVCELEMGDWAGKGTQA